MATFTIYKDESWEYRWRLKARNHETIADSGEGYSRRTACRKAVNRFKKLTGDAAVEDRRSSSSLPRFEVYRDSSSEYRWRFKARNGEIVADSAEGYTSRYSAKQAARRVKRKAPTASITDRTRRSA